MFCLPIEITAETRGGAFNLLAEWSIALPFDRSSICFFNRARSMTSARGKSLNCSTEIRDSRPE